MTQIGVIYYRDSKGKFSGAQIPILSDTPEVAVAREKFDNSVIEFYMKLCLEFLENNKGGEYGKK